MGVFSGPDLKEDGLVLYLDAGNNKSFKGQSATNLYYVDAGSSANNSIFHMPMGGTATGSYTTSHSYGSWSGNTIFKVTVSSGTLAGGYESFRSCVSSSFDSTYGTTRRLSAKVKMLKGSITSLSYHTGGGTGGHSSSHYTPISESSVPTDVLSKDGWYQFDMDVSGSYPFGHCVGIGIVGSDIEFLVTEMMLYPSSTFVRFTPTTRGTTVATGGGWADLIGNGNHGELVNGVREDSANGGSLVFDGTNDYVDIPNALSSISNSNFHTFSFWFNADNLSTDKIPFSSGLAGNYYIQLTSSVFYVQIGSSYRTYSFSTSTNIWYNVCFVKNGINDAGDLYINSSLKSSYTGSITSTPSGLSSLFLGKYYSGYAFPGKIAQVQIYNKALTASEIQQNFNATRSRFGI